MCEGRCNNCGYCTPDIYVKDEGTGDRPYFIYIECYFTGLRFGDRRTADQVVAFLRRKV